MVKVNGLNSVCLRVILEKGCYISHKELESYFFQDYISQLRHLLIKLFLTVYRNSHNALFKQ